MFSGFPLFPEQASTVASSVDSLYLFLVLLTLVFSLLIATLVVVFAVKYRRRSAADVGAPMTGSVPLELMWSIIPFGIAMGIFVWGANVFFTIQRPPDETIQIYAVGKRWMWKFQHIDGDREINELHVPVGRAVKLTVTSEDVIHDVYVPAFRVKVDAIPGRYTTLWFTPTKPGEYHLFCAEYCGTKHSGMVGKVIVMEPAGYQDWLSGGSATTSMADTGERLFQDLACNNCHLPDGSGRGPSLETVYGASIRLTNGQVVTADEGYLRESILNPQAKVTAGYQPQMPTFQGLVDEEGLMALLEYLRSRHEATATEGAGTPGAAPVPAMPDRQGQ